MNHLTIHGLPIIDQHFVPIFDIRHQQFIDMNPKTVDDLTRHEQK